VFNLASNYTVTCYRKAFTFERLQAALLQALKPHGKHKRYEFRVYWTVHRRDN